MGQLDGGNAAVGFDKAGDAGERGDVAVGPDAEVARGDAAFGADGGGFGHDHARSTYRAAAEVDQVPLEARPSTALYWHMGETAMRLGRVMLRCWRGEKRWSGAMGMMV